VGDGARQSVDIAYNAPYPREFLLGKLTPYFVIGMIDLVVSVTATVSIFDVPLRGSFLGLSVVSAMSLLAVMIRGAIISITAGNQLLASQMPLVFTFLPAVILSGFAFPIQNMPLPAQYLTYLNPLRYFMVIIVMCF